MTAPGSSSSNERCLLVCPECVARFGGEARIGNRKGRAGQDACRLCNRFAQAVRRLVAKDLVHAHPDEATRLRHDAEQKVYARLVGAA